jgi:branched-chain amino acid transport system substrate-binding protein
MTEIAVGIAAPLSGRAAKLGRELLQAVGLAIDEANARGGIAGMRIRPAAADDGSSVVQAEQVARMLGREKDLAGVIGHYSSDTSLAAARIYREQGLALLAPVASNPQLTESGLSNVFRYTNRDDRTAEAISRYLYTHLQKRKAVVIKTTTAYGNSMSARFEKAFTEAGGSLLASLPVGEGEKDFGALVRCLPATADLFFYGGTFEGAYLLKALRAHGYTQLMATGDGCWDRVNFLDIAGDAAEAGEGVLVLSASSAIGDVPGSAEFAAKYERLHGPVVNYALNAYDTACILLRAIEAAAVTGGVARDQVTSAIRTVRFTGLANPNPLAWTDKGDHAGAITRLSKVQNGQFSEIVWQTAGQEAV